MKIAHISDIQVRSLKRHDEFISHFENLYNSLRDDKPDCIVITGDILHQKLIISPELIRVVSDLFRNLSDICPVYVIAGNHDALLGQKTRLDALSPIIENINRDNLIYYKHSGVYDIKDNFSFVVFSCLDDEDDWPEETNKERINIGLYHGMVDGLTFQNGFVVNDTGYELDYFFDMVDYLLMGDIHEVQSFYNDRAAYPGSLIQQNYGESRNKGYLIWDIESKQNFDVKFKKLPNICPFYNIKLKDDLSFVSSSVPDDVQSGARIKLHSRELTLTEKKELKEKLALLWDPSEVSFDDSTEMSSMEILVNDKTIKADDILDVSTQNELIERYLQPFNLDKDTLDAIYEMNKEYNAQILSGEQIARGVTYKFLDMRFSNTFSFGEANVFDFTKNPGLVGVFGKSGVGKSALIVDNPLYGLFNKISKKGVVKNDLIINENKEYCSVTINLQREKDFLKIDRKTSIYLKSGKKKGAPIYQGKTELDFKVVRNGQEIDMNGSERADTDKNIRNMIGDMDSFILTAVAPQWQLLGLIDSGNTDRLKIISNYFGVDLFDKKHALAKEDQRDIKGVIKSLQDINFDRDIEAHKEQIKDYEARIVKLSNESGALDKEKRIINEEKARLIVLKENSCYDMDILKAEMHIKALGSEKKSADKNRLSAQAKMERLNKYACLSNLNCALQNEYAHHEDDLKKSNLEMQVIDEKLKIQQDKLSELLEKKNNLDDDTELQNLKKKEDEFFTRTREIEKSVHQLVESAARLKERISALETQKNKFFSVKERFDCFEYYLKAMGKDGIVKQIIYDNLGIINKEMDKILSSTVNFRAELQVDAKELEIYFKPQRGQKRKIELCSGMEKTMVAVALRVALAKITTLPKANIFILDEPAGALDPEYLDSFGRMMEYLKNYFETIFIISHDEVIKDFCDHIYEIDRDENGYARIS